MITRRHTCAIGQFGILEWFGWDGTEMVLLATIGGGPRRPHTKYKKTLFTLFDENIQYTGKDASISEHSDASAINPQRCQSQMYTYVIRVPVKGSALATLASTAESIASALESTLTELRTALAQLKRSLANEDEPLNTAIC